MQLQYSASAMALLAASVAAASPPLRRVERSELCVTLGKIGQRGTTLTVVSPKMRAVVDGKMEAAAELRFVYRGATSEIAALASGRVRRQIGLKLRAQDGCNLLYVMFRLDPAPTIVVSLKRNPGMRTHADCGAHGYTNLTPERAHPVAQLVAGEPHVLAAALTGHRLTVRFDKQVVWEGAVDGTLDTIEGPVGLRSDNVAVDFEFWAPPRVKATHSCMAAPDDND